MFALIRRLALASSALLPASPGREAEFVHTAWPSLMADPQADAFDLAIGGARPGSIGPA